MEYIEYNFVVKPIEPWRDILVAELGSVGFESFVETENGVDGFIQEELFIDDDFNNMNIFSNDMCEVTFKSSNVEPKNWNEEWEKNFSPIIVGDNCVIRAPFHEKTNVEFEIIIEPKMSFGTGHHETTHLITEYILGMDMTNKVVMDMGCGTGILAILAGLKGSKEIDAVDMDEWAYENTVENAQRNNVDFIKVYKGDASFLNETPKYDLFIANINRNILTNDMDKYVKTLKTNGNILFSGFYESDVDIIVNEAKKHNLTLVEKKTKNSWAALKFKK